MLKTMLVGVVLLLAYCLTRVYIGHGDAPAALVLVAGRTPMYASIAILGWLGICTLIAAVWLAHRRAGPVLFALAVGLLLLSWVGLLWVTANKELTLLTGTPFLLVAAWALFRRGRVGRPVQDTYPRT